MGVSTTADTPASLLSTTVDTPASPPPPPCISPATPPLLSPPMVAMPPLDVTSPTPPEPSTSPRGRLRLMPTMAMVDMADTEAMEDTAMAMVDMVDMVDTDTTVRGRLRCWPRFKMTFCLKHTAAEYLVQNMNLNQLPSTVEASPYPTMDMVRSTDMELQNTQHCPFH